VTTYGISKTIALCPASRLELRDFSIAVITIIAKILEANNAGGNGESKVREEPVDDDELDHPGLNQP
jgi:hypothetical protein